MTEFAPIRLDEINGDGQGGNVGIVIPTFALEQKQFHWMMRQVNWS